MCTSFLYRAGGGYFGRNLDLDAPFGEKVIITPRNYSFALKNGKNFSTAYAMIGMAAQAGTYPLYADAVNEKGLAMAGLNFPGNAVCHPAVDGRDNITPFELIPWILGQAAGIDEALELLRKVNLLDVPFAENMPLAPLHFMVADSRRSVVAEPVKEGFMLYDDPYNVMTNNPVFPYHDWNMKNYRRLSAGNGEQCFASDGDAAQFDLAPYAEGMGSIGLPGDPSSASRFVRAAFHLASSECGDAPLDPVTEVFHILDSVAMTAGSVRTAGGGLDITRYSACIDLKDGNYYYKTYTNSRITKVPFSEKHRGGESLAVYPLRTEQSVFTEPD